jgi:hypothetical protein
MDICGNVGFFLRCFCVCVFFFLISFIIKMENFRCFSLFFSLFFCCRSFFLHYHPCVLF